MQQWLLGWHLLHQAFMQASKLVEMCWDCGQGCHAQTTKKRQERPWYFLIQVQHRGLQ